MHRRHFFILFILIALVGVASLIGSGSPPAFKKTLRVMTYNIHVGVGMDKKLDLKRIAEVINHERPDLVGLQEVDRGVERTQRIDEIAEIAKLTRMEYAFAYNLNYQGGQYGVAVLSRFPIMAIDHRRYGNTREKERRGMIRVELDVGGRVVNFVTTHLDYQYEDGRVYEAKQLLQALDGIKGALIVVGDLNDLPGAEAHKIMTSQFQDAWVETAASGEGLSYPADKPAKRIDYIFYRTDGGVRARRAWTINTLASDHLPVAAELEIH
jgi:endonuclease/exonuclease/phosphatase family metal-dependent hydrolase